TAEVGKVFAQGQFTIYMRAVQHGVAIKLAYNYMGFFIKFFGVFRCPPIVKVTVRIVLTALVVKSVCHFMSYYSPYAAIVYRVICILVEEGILQDTGGENDFVECRVVVGV